jgi:CHASE1-domain containing sensor protein
LAGNEKALGYDTISEATRRKALEQAAATGQATATSRVTLVQGGADGYGVLVARPVYEKGVIPAQPAQRRAHLTGYVLGVLRIGDIVAAGQIDSGPAVRLVVLDNDAPKGSHLLHPKALGIDTVDGLPPGLRVSKDLRIGGHSWTVAAMPGPGAFTPNRGASLSIMVLCLLIAAKARPWRRPVRGYRARRCFSRIWI